MKQMYEKGFTLIEVMVAMVIMAVTLLALGAFTLTVLNADNIARQRTVATHLAEQELENWYSSTYVPAPGNNGWPKTVNGEQYSLADPGGVSGVWTAALVDNTSANARAVTVYWTTKGTTRSVTVSHMQRVQ